MNEAKTTWVTCEHATYAAVSDKLRTEQRQSGPTRSHPWLELSPVGARGHTKVGYGVHPQVVDDQVGRLTFTSEIARGVRHRLTSDAPFGTYNLTGCGQPRSWFDIARRVYDLTGHDPERVSPVSTAAYFAGKDGIAPRPANSVLDLSKLESAGFFPADHDTSLRKYLRAE